MSEALPDNNPVYLKFNELLQQGAAEIDSSFSVATLGQNEVILGDRRLLITPNDDAYHEYVEILRDSGVGFLAQDKSLSDDSVVVGEIPRDSLSLEQVAHSGKNEGATPTKIFEMVGEGVDRLIKSKGLAPRPEDFILSKVLLGRSTMNLMIAPPMGFCVATQDHKSQLEGALRQQLEPKFARFGGLALQESFKKGLG